MSPSQNHELIKDFIFLLVTTYCDAFDLDYYPTGSTTYKDRSKQVGKEPDTSFCFNNLQKIPDLAIKVVFSSGGTDDLNKYQQLEVQEVWFLRMETLPSRELVPHSRWINSRLKIYILLDGVYQEQQNSFNLPKIEAKLLTKYIAQALNGNPRVLKQSFLAEIK